MTIHLEETLQRDFDRILALVTKMAELAGRSLRDCVTALEKRDRDLAGVIILRDQRIDQLENEIDRLCLEFLLRHQPAGGHLRFAHATLQINFELERVGDYAESIARQILKLLDCASPIPAGLFAEISSAAISMLHNAVAAFVRQDAELAGVTAQIEERVDVLRDQANSELVHLVQINQIPLAALTPLMTIARRFERVSDQAKAMCQATLYFQTGKYARHSGAFLCRVLFVDEHHGYASRMGEWIGRALNRSEFEFSSAGIDPRPLDDGAISLLRRLGVNATDRPAMRAQDIPQFEQYQVLIALSAAVKGLLPPPARKTIQFTWAMPEDPSTPERSYSFLSKRISELVNAILGEDQT